MSTVLIAGVLGIALVDAINPSALAVTTYLVSRPRPWPAVAAYIAGIFITYLSVGLVVVFALASVIDRVIEALNDPAVASSVQLVAGVAIVVLVAQTFGRRVARRRAIPTVLRPGRTFLLGVTITAIEVTTALPYVGALAAIVRADIAAPDVVLLLIAYNLVFVAPPVLVAAAARWSNGRFERLRFSISRTMRPGRPIRLLAQVAGIVLGAGLVVHGLVGFIAAETAG